MTEDQFAHLFAITKEERPLLSSKENVTLLAKLKDTSPERYEELLARLKANEVPRLRELEEAVKKRLRQAVVKNTGAQKPVEDDGFQRDQHGVPIASQGNIRLAIKKLGVTVRYNMFKRVVVIDGLPGFGPALDDPSLNRLWLTIEDRFGFRPRQDFFNIVVADDSHLNRFHPVADYLDGLVWDGVPRLDSWLTRYCGVEDTPFARAAGMLVLIAAVRRIREPGCKFDEMLVLESPEGFNKSTLLAMLAVEEDWFTDSLPLAADDKKMIEHSGGKWICEVSELQGMRKADVGVLKAQLSRRSDRGRLAYARLVSEVPRQFVCIGTVNPSEAAGYLASLTGNRRFWPVTVQRIDLEAFEADRDQLWAEAAAREARGESIRLDPELWDAATAEQRKREAPNAFYDVLLPVLGNHEGVIFASDIWAILGIPVDRRNANASQMGAAMKRMGWSGKKRRRGGKPKEKVYVRGDSDAVLELVYEFDLGGQVAAVRATDAEAMSEATDE